MRILLVSHAFLPHSLGGVEVCTANVAQALHRMGHDVHVFHRISQPDHPEYEVQETSWEGLSVTTINNTFSRVDRFEMAYRNMAIEEAFAAWLNRWTPPDVVHFQHLTCLSTGLPLVTRAQGIPSVLTLHDYWLACQRGQMLQPDLTLCAEPESAKCARCLASQIRTGQPLGRAVNWMIDEARPPSIRSVGRLAGRALPETLRKRDHRHAVREIQARTRHVNGVMRTVNLLITPSEYHRGQFVHFGVPAERVVVRHNGQHTELFRDHPHVPADHLRLVFLGSVIPSKGVHILIEAFNGIDDKRASLDIHGWAPPYEGFPTYFQDLKAQATGRVRFHGPYENSQVAAILAQTDALVVPSIWPENSPVTIQEARMAGVPVVASRIGGIPEFVQDDVSGLLFTPRDVEDLRAALQRLVNDPSLLNHLREGIQRVKTIEEHALELEAIYGQVVAGDRP
jgi:glycosyltransferase involved in cell wall biosynthesis